MVSKEVWCSCSFSFQQSLVDRILVPQFVAEQEFGVNGTLSPSIFEVERKVVISSSFVSLGQRFALK